MKKKLYFSLFLSLLATPLLAQPGTLDETFNGIGIKEFTFSQNLSQDEVTASILQPDGKLLAVVKGYYDAGNFQRNESVIVRLLKDGTLDASFGIAGRFSLDNVQSGFAGMSIALRADGRIVLGGHILDQYGSVIPYIVGLTANGSKDELFGSLVTSTTRSGSKQLSDGDMYYGYSFKTIQIDPSTGNIFAGASRLDETGYDFMLASVDRLGDENYIFPGGDGDTYITSFSLADAQYHTVSASLVHASSRTLFIVGTVYNFEQTPANKTKRFAVLALNMRTGRLVNSFFYNTQQSEGGKAVLPLSPGKKLNECTGIQFSPDSSGIFLSGYAQKDETTAGVTDIDYMIYKIGTNGGIDSKFAGDGIATYRYPSTPSSVQNYAFSFLVQPNGKMVLGGSVGTGNSFAAVMRVNADSTVDSRFGNKGYVVYNQDNSETYNSFQGINRLHYLDGKYVILGNYTVNGFTDAFAKRLNNEGGNDNSYGNSSVVKLWAFGDNTVLRDAAVRAADGSLWVCGNSSLGGPAVALVKSDGSLTNTGIVALSSYFPSTMFSPVVTAITLYSGKPVLAGHYVNNSGVNDLFILQLKTDGTLDTQFGNGGFTTLGLSSGYHYAHDLVVQEGKGILLYGYHNGVTTLVRFGFDGIRHTTFAGSGSYSPPFSSVGGNESILEERKVEIKLWNGKIYGISTRAVTNNQFLVFRLLEDGAPDATYGNSGSLGYYNGSYSFYSCIPTSLAIRTDGSACVGGHVTYSGEQNFALFLLKPSGSSVDSSFNVNGYQVFDKKSTEEKITNVSLEDDNTITASGTMRCSGKLYQVAMRFKSNGKADKTFNGTGFATLQEGVVRNSLLVENKLYLIGSNRESNGVSNYLGQITKIKLGVGTISKPTTLALANLSKTFGDEPFKLQAVTNSPAPVFYAVVQSNCATVDAKTGLVTITCATVDSGTPIVIRAVQAPTNGYAAATTTATINVAKAYPRIYFPTQGGTTGTNFKLQSYSESSLNADAYPYYNQIDGTAFLYYNYYTDSVEAYAEGEAQIQVNYNETRDYLSASKTTTIYVYDAPVPPVANADAAELVFGEGTNLTLNILANDEAYSGTVMTQLTDLDPSSPGIQDTYVSPSLGLFKADSNGIVTYTPFTGFIGSGSISYTITDSKGLQSEPASVSISVVSQIEAPALKATEMVTPNNDGLNEAFVIGYINLEKQNQLKIFDRSGQELYAQENYKNDWTGILPNGKLVENGIYYYVFVEGSADNQRELKGAFEIRR